MRRLLAFLILAIIKTISWIFFKASYKWLTPLPKDHWKKIRIMVFLNHTSLYEPLFLQIIPFRYLWHLSGHFNIPGADITLRRPVVGRFWKLMIPNISSISRKKDLTWLNYLKSIKTDDVIMIAAEGRMKRPNGLDKFGKPMTVRGGVADIIDTLNEGAMVLCFSGGLHHIQAPGQLFPHLFKTINMNFSYHEIKKYKSEFQGDPRKRKLKIVRDLQARLERDCP
jgi:hypothetical protein